jgi:hypothetical protein
LLKCNPQYWSPILYQNIAYCAKCDEHLKENSHGRIILYCLSKTCSQIQKQRMHVRRKKRRINTKNKISCRPKNKLKAITIIFWVSFYRSYEAF